MVIYMQSALLLSLESQLEIDAKISSGFFFRSASVTKTMKNPHLDPDQANVTIKNLDSAFQTAPSRRTVRKAW